MQSYKSLEDNIQENLSPGFGNDLLNTTSKAQYKKERINKWGLIKIKYFCFTKDTLEKMKTQSTEQEKNFAKFTSDKAQCTKKC